MPESTTKYKPEYDHIAYEFCKCNGFTDKGLANLFQVVEQTINNWKADHPSFLEFIKKGKDEHDTYEVENALLKRAKGFEYKEVQTILDSNGKPIPDQTKVMQKQALPDTGACAFWLKNRNSARWREKDQHIDKPAVFLETLEFIAKVLHEIDPEGLRVLSKNFQQLVSRFKAELKEGNEKSA